MVQQAIDSVWRKLQSQEEEIRKMKGQLAGVLIGARLVSTIITGVVPPDSGGSGIVGSPLGVTIWQNNSGGLLSQGAVVIASGDRLFTTTTSAGNRRVIGVLDGNAASDSTGVASNEQGRIRHVGYQSVVNVVGAVTAFDFLRTSTTAGRAASAGTTLADGVFAIALTAFAGPGNGTVTAYILPVEFVDSFSAYNTVEDEGTGLTQRSTLNFTGAGVTASDSGGKTVVNIPSGGGAPTDGEYVTYAANGGLSAERVVFTSATTGTIPKILYKASDETVNNSDVLQNDDDLILPLAANEVWAFQCFLSYDSAANADIKVAFTIPAGASFVWQPQYRDAADAWTVTTGVASGTSVTFGGAGAGTVRGVWIMGFVINGANAGNLQLQWAQGTQQASNTIVKAGSWLLGYRAA